MRKFLILFSIILSIQTFSEGNYITIKPSKQSEEKNKVSKIDDTGNDYINIGTNEVSENIGVYDTTVVGSNNFVKSYYYNLKKTNDLDEFHISSTTVLGMKNTTNDGIVVGNENTVLGGGVSIGTGNKVLNDRAFVIGQYSQAKQYDSIAVGFAAKAFKSSAQAIGSYSEARGVGSISLGNSAISEGTGVALGYNSKATRSSRESAYILDSEFKDLKNSDVIAKFVNKEERVKEIFNELESLKGDKEKYNEYILTINNRDSMKIKANEKLAEIYEAERDKQSEEEINTLKDEYKKLKEQYKEIEDKETEIYLKNIKGNKNIDKIKNLTSEYWNIIGKYTSSLGAVSVGNEDKGETRQIINVAGGSKDTDAVNVSQLKAITLNVEGNNETKAKIKLSENKFIIKGVENEIYTKVDNEGVHIGLSESIKNKFDENTKNSKMAISGISNSIAISNLPQVSENNKYSISAAYGYYGKNISLAIGFSGRTKNKNLIYKLSASVNNELNVGFGGGLSYQFGDINNTSNIEKRLDKLEKENQELREFIKQNLKK